MQNSMESACLNKQSEGWTKILALPQKLQIALLHERKT
jgi:hypothetical protein